LVSSRRTLSNFSGRASLALSAVTLVFALALLALPGSAAAANSPELKRYPYLTDVAGTSATVNWGTTRLYINGALKYGKVGSENCTDHTVTATKTAITVGGVSEYQWKARLTLEPDTEYCYRIYFGTSPQIDLLADDPSPTFRSALPAGSSTPFSFDVFGDWGHVQADGTNPDQANLISQIAASGARFAVTTGDNAYPAGLQNNYGDLVQTGQGLSGVFGPSFWKVAGSSLSLFPIVGNHGFASAGATAHLVNWPQDSAVAASGGTAVRETYCCLNGTISGSYPSVWYAFDVGIARFYMLEAAWTDANLGTSDKYGNDYAYHWTPDSAEYKWLQNDLAANPRQLKFAFFHFPLFADTQSQESDTYLQGPDSLEGLLSHNGVNIAFSGHSHIYQRNRKPYTGSLINYVTGGGGAEVASVGEGGCSSFDAYAIGWSHTTNSGTACGAAPIPASIQQVFHFLKVSVNGPTVTVTPTDSLGRTFDVVTYNFAPTGNLTCDGSYTGVTLKDVVVPKGGYCTLTNSTVTGNVKAAEGATFIAHGTSMRQNVQADRAARIAIDGSTVGGAVTTAKAVAVDVSSTTVKADFKVTEGATAAVCSTTITEGTLQIEKVKGSVRIGDPAGCGGNLVQAKNLIVRDNVISGQLLIRANTVSRGNLEVTNNTGTGDKTVEGNTGIKTLKCNGNAPPFSASGNTGWTQRAGQCL
jgi:hypothetical protein